MCIRADIAALNGEIARLARPREDGALFDSVEGPDLFDRQIATLRLDGDSYGSIIESLNKKKSALNAMLSTPIGLRKRVLDSMSEIADRYCERLGVGEYFRQDPKGLLSSTLKDKSGSCYHLLVFAFRLTYAKVVERELGKTLPLVIDSPRSREMSVDNFLKCMALLREEFSDRQVIVASISSDSIEHEGEIMLTENPMSSSKLIPSFDHESWERCEDVVWLTGRGLLTGMRE